MTIKITRRDLLNGMVISAGGIAFNSYASGPAVGGDSPVTSGFTPPGLLPTYPPALTGMRGSHEGYYEVAHALAWEGKKPATYQSLDEHYDLISMFTKADQAAVEKQELVLVLKKIRSISMAGWLIANIKVTNPEGFAEYRDLVPQTIADHGGEYVVADVNSTAVEGEWPHLSVVLKFPSLEACKTWYNSPEYQAILALRTDNSEGNLAFAEY